MASINNRKLQETLDYLLTLGNILNKEIKSIDGNRYNLDKVVPEHLIKVYSQKQNTASDFVKNLHQANYEAHVVTLVAVFESIVFAKYKTSYGKIKSVVGTHAERPLDYFKSREKFVDGSVEKLHVIMELIEGHVDDELFQNLERIKEQRDYFAHGKRFGKAPAIDVPIEEIALTLDRAITEIEN